MEKVKNFIKEHSLLTGGETVVAAVSGGPDSLCLLHMLGRALHELKLKIVVAHLNHCLRPEAGKEALFVEKIAADWSMPFEMRVVDIRALKKERQISEEEAGRLARYNLFREVAAKYHASAVVLGHHRDDQAETVLLNIIRGTGVDGLAGILPCRRGDGLKFLRPLLCLTRKEIEAYCNAKGLQPCTDSSNLETNYTRNKLRLELIPRLEKEFNPRIRESLSGLASLVLKDRLFMDNLTEKHSRRLMRDGGNKTVVKRAALMTLPGALQGRVLRRILEKSGLTEAPGREHIEALLDMVKEGRRGWIYTLPGAVHVYDDGRFLQFFKKGEPQQLSSVPIQLTLPGRTVIPGKGSVTACIVKPDQLFWPPPACRAYLDYDKIDHKNLAIRFRWAGARFYPQGASGSRKLKKFFIDQKIPAPERASVPLLTTGDEIIWIVGKRIAHPYRVTGETERVLLLEYRVFKKRRF
ncbi:MAG: tRNA lysidine(34) synthetase TilS [Bacillota bacterium]|nr:tRNA lysidine(34) synthetase TilS [Bacillota bacterium]